MFSFLPIDLNKHQCQGQDPQQIKIRTNQVKTLIKEVIAVHQ